MVLGRRRGEGGEKPGAATVIWGSISRLMTTSMDTSVRWVIPIWYMVILRGEMRKKER